MIGMKHVPFFMQEVVCLSLILNLHSLNYTQWTTFPARQGASLSNGLDLFLAWAPKESK